MDGSSLLLPMISMARTSSPPVLIFMFNLLLSDIISLASPVAVSSSACGTGTILAGEKVLFLQSI
ncbi:MAG: hypothetical protein JJE45_00515 [Prolixibacteraceae bacterium]|nr:hypothetical protein [Prolixibacteraceae bacterium]